MNLRGDLTGQDVVAYARRDAPRLGAIYISGYDDIGVEEDEDTLVLRKPFSYTLLREAVERLTGAGSGTEASY